MKKVKFAVMTLAGAAAWIASAAAVRAADAPTAADLLKDSDRARGAVASGISWSSVIDTADEGNTSHIEYVIKAKGDQAVAETTAPAANKGEFLVFKERNLWFLKPGMKRAVVISARQKLSGPASNADIAGTNYVRDYDGKINGEEKIDGVDCWKLELKAKAKNVSYNGINYWVTKSTHLGVKAQFLSVKGDVFKVATFKYGNKLRIDGKDTPFMSEITIAEAQRPQNSSVIKIAAPKVLDIPDGSLDLNNLKK